MHSTPSNAAVHQQGEKKQKSSYWPFLCGMIGCISLPAFLLALGIFGYALFTADGGEVGRLLKQVKRSNSRQQEALETMQVLRNAISLHDAQNRPLTGTSLRPLLGRYLQELPNDPWGNEFLLDSSVGLLATYGADALPGGKGSDEDAILRYKSPLRIVRAQYDGKWGHPNEKNVLYLTFSKPFEIVDERELMRSLVLLKDSRNHKDGLPIAFSKLRGKGHDWKVDMAKSDAKKMGTLVLRNHAKLSSAAQSVTPTMAIDLKLSPQAPRVESGEGVAERFGLKEVWLAYGPLDSTIFGSEAKKFLSLPESTPRYRDQVRGIKIERY